MNKYHKQLIESNASENIVGLFSRYKGASKEVTESFGIFAACRKVIPDINQHLVYVIGDGASPRTGAVFAYFTKAEVVSIDPQFNMDHWEKHTTQQKSMGYPITRLEVIKKKIEDCQVFNCNQKRIIIVFPHSHASMEETLKKFTNYKTRYIVNMPCCVPIPTNFAKIPHTFIKDTLIVSPKNEIHIWYNL